MIYSQSFNLKIALGHRFPPIQLAYGFLTEHIKDISCVFCRDNGNVFAQAPEARNVEMIEVSMRDQDQIQRRELVNSERRRHKTLRPERAEPEEARARSLREDRIGDDLCPIKINEDGRMADPGGGDR